MKQAQAPQPTRLKTAVFTTLTFVIALALSLAAAEAIVRFKNASMKDYNTEMWRYARELKVASPDSRLGHEHIPNSSAVLQSTDIRINAWGLRGGAVSDKPAVGTRRILLLGSSIALGWGVPEDKVVSTLLEQKLRALGQNVEVLNAGIGNYNAERYVERFLTRLAPLRPSDLLVLAFVRDGEELAQGSGNILLRHSQLAATAWIAGNRLFARSGEASLVEHYKAIYQPGSTALATMRSEFAKLAAYARANSIRVTMAMVPDIHILGEYPLLFVHDIFAQTARENGFAYVDLLPVFRGLKPQEIWAMPGDPHPNARGHDLMAGAIYPLLAHAPAEEQKR